MLNWDDLKLVHAVIETGGLSAAARHLRSTQPTVGRRIQALEEDLGIVLFERRAEGYRPTAAAKALLPQLERMAEAAALVERELSIINGQTGGPVRVAATSWMGRFLAERLGRLREMLPGIEIAIEADGRSPQLGVGDVHLAIFRHLPEQPGLKSRIVCRAAFAIYGAGTYVQAHPAATTEARFTACDWAMYDIDRAPGGKGPDWLAGRLGPAVHVLRTTATATLLSVLEGGGGLGMLPCFVGDAHERLVRVSPILPEMEHVYRLFLHQDIARAARVRRTADAIAALYAEERVLLGGAGKVAPAVV
jgi:DNA-binding transcriptional LysR family regulator